MQHNLKLREQIIFEHILSNKRIRSLKHAHCTSIHVAIIIKRGKILAEATNAIGSRSKGSGYSSHTIHAERNVIKDIGNINNLRGATMYVIRISRGDMSSPIQGSKPCVDCTLFLHKCMDKYGLKNVLYTSD